VKLGLRERLFFVSAGVLLVGALVIDVGLGRALSRGREADLLEEAKTRASLVALQAEDADLGDVDLADALADTLGARASARVTLFDARGRIVGDSSFDPSAIRELPSGAPDSDAHATEPGDAARRFSTSSQETRVFASHPILRAGAVVGVARVGLPTDALDAVRSKVDVVVLLIALAGLVVAGILSTLAARLATQGVRELAILGRRLAGGDLDARPRPTGEDELADLGRSLDQLALGLRSTLKELVGERDLLSGILTSMREGVLVVDPDGKVAIINPAMREMLLVSGDVIGKMTLEVIRDTALVDLLDAARRHPEQPAQGEIEVLGLKPRRFLVRAELLDVEPGGVLVVFYDVTDLRRLESLRRDFVANASHELRTPVTLVRSAAETVVSIPERDGEARERFLGIIVRNAERLQTLIDDLLDLSKIEARELDLAADPVDLRVLAERVVSLLAEPAARTATRVVVAIADDAPRPSADARALEQILMNLADNAIKYCPGRTVTVRASRRGDAVAIEVADDGPGIEPQHLQRLFERFYRVDTGRSRQLGGTGLGLSIVKHLAEAMGGSADVESEVGVGTTFRIELPIDRMSSRPPPAAEAADATV